MMAGHILYMHHDHAFFLDLNCVHIQVPHIINPLHAEFNIDD